MIAWGFESAKHLKEKLSHVNSLEGKSGLLNF
jgi:hypothetical protein